MHPHDIHLNLHDVPGTGFGEEFPIRLCYLGMMKGGHISFKGPTLLILTYNIGDTVGKYISGFRAYYTETLQIIVLLLRFGFYATFILIVKGVKETKLNKLLLGHHWVLVSIPESIHFCWDEWVHDWRVHAVGPRESG
jgi:hypothetical protein